MTHGEEAILLAVLSYFLLCDRYGLWCLLWLILVRWLPVGGHRYEGRELRHDCGTSGEC